MIEQKMYLGPSRPYGLGLIQHAIIKDAQGVAGLQKALAEKKELGKLLVAIPKLAKAQVEIKTKGSDLYKAYQTVKAETEAGGK